MLKKYKWEIVVILIAIILTILFREYAVERRVSLGLEPSWGSEFSPLLFLGLYYSVTKSDWSVD